MSIPRSLPRPSCTAICAGRWSCSKQMFVLAFGGAGFGLLSVGLFSLFEGAEQCGPRRGPSGCALAVEKDWAAGKIISSSKTARGGVPDGGDRREPGHDSDVVRASRPIDRQAQPVRPVGLASGHRPGAGLLGHRRADALAQVPSIRVPDGVRAGGHRRATRRRNRHLGQDSPRETAFTSCSSASNGQSPRAATATPSGKRSSWQRQQVVAHELLKDNADQSAIPVQFQIPCDCRPTGGEEHATTRSSGGWRQRRRCRAWTTAPSSTCRYL